MRCNWQRWLWGLIPLVLVSWVAIQVERDRIEQDLTARAQAALADSGSRWAGVEISGRDVVLMGRAFQDSEPPQAERALRDVWGVRAVENRAILPRKVTPFIWSARRRGNRIKLSGYVPDRATRRTVLGLTKAAMPSVEVSDRMNTARGVPSADAWLAGLSFALKQLSLMKNGDARFEDLVLTISGEAEDPAAYKSLNTALKSGLPNGIRLASAEIAAPVVSPFTWSARFAAGQLVMAGHVAGGDKVRAELLTAVKAVAPALDIVDRMEPAEGAPEGWAGVAAAVIKGLVRLESGTVEMKDSTFMVGGIAPDEPQAQSIRAALRASVPSGFALVDQIRVREVKPPEPPPAAPSPTLNPKHGEPAPVSRTETSSVAPAPAPQEAPMAPAPRPEAQPPSQEAATRAPEQRSDTPAAGAPPASQPADPAAEPRQMPPEPPQQATASPRAVTMPRNGSGAVPQAPPDAASKQATTEAPPKEDARPSPAAAEPAPRTATAPPQPPPAPSVSPPVDACQDSLGRITPNGHINFATDSATLESSSFATLDRLAAAARSCPGIRIAIEGHTDAEGSAAYNQRLSVRRAKAVETYLVRAGADRKQLEAVGYGLSRPVAPNDTEDNMARNRRIEFSVRQE
jgi:outer membrane protein OmpA-like peptidoglycan-associated protein